MDEQGPTRTNRDMKIWILRLALLLALGLAGFAAEVAASFDFEQGAVGQAPPGWAVTPDAAAGYAVKITDEKPEGGRFCALLESTGTPAPQGFGLALRSLDAGPYRGKRVRFRAAVRAELGRAGPAGPALASAPEGPPRATSTPCRGRSPTPKWAPYEIVGEIPKDAGRLEIGLVLVGDGKAFLDSGPLRGDRRGGHGQRAGPAAHAPAVWTTSRPSPGCSATSATSIPATRPRPRTGSRWPWPASRPPRSRATPEELARALEDFFRPVAPTVRVFPTGRPPAAGRPWPAGRRSRVAWEHHGVALSKEPRSIYKSSRVTHDGLSGPRPAKPFAGRPGGRRLGPDPPGALRRRPGHAPPCRRGGQAARPRQARRLPPRRQRPRHPAGRRGAGLERLPALLPLFRRGPGGLAGRAAARASPPRPPTPTTRAFLATLRRLVAALHDGHGNVFHLAGATAAPAPPALGLGGGSARDHPGRTRRAPAGSRRATWWSALDGKPGPRGRWRRGRSWSPAPRRSGGAAVALQTGCARTPRTRRCASRCGTPTARPSTAASPVALRPTATGSLEETRPEKIAEMRPGIFYVDIDRIDDEEFKGAARPPRRRPRGSSSTCGAIPAGLADRPRPPDRRAGHLGALERPVVTRPDRQGWHLDFSSWSVQPQEPRFTGQGRLPHRRPGHQLRRDLHGDHRELQAGRHRRRPHGGHQRQRQPLHAPRRLPRGLDRHEGAQARRLAAPRRRHPADRPRRRARSREWPPAGTRCWRRRIEVVGGKKNTD